jgi:Ca-activated chloride channel homolog
MGRTYLVLFVVLLFSFNVVQGATISQYFSNNRAIEAYNDEAYDEALESFSDALGQGEESGDIHQNIGHVYFKKKDYDNAIVAYEKAMSSFEGQKKHDSMYNLGTSYLAKGDLEKAKDSYVSLLRDEPAHENGKKNLEAVLTLLKAQKKQQQQQQPKDDKKKKKKKEKRKQPQRPQDPEKKKKDDRKKNAKQLLNMLSEKEKEARQKHKKPPEQELSVEKDW